MDIEALRQQYLAETKAGEAAAPPPPSAASVAEHAASGEADETETCRMIASLSLDKENYAATVRALLDMLSQPELGTKARLAALRQLGSAEFHPARFAPFHPEYISLLRRLALDPDKELRGAVLDRLSLTGDPEALRLLREGLEKVRKPLLPAAKAVQLLARDDHGSSLPIFRALAVSGAGKVREEALRALGSDTRSAPLFEALAGDKKEKAPIREIAAVNLKNTSSSRFAKFARKLVLDEEDDDRLRAAAMSAITHTRAVADKVVTPGFTDAVRALGSATRSRALKSSISRFSKLVGGE